MFKFLLRKKGMYRTGMLIGILAMILSPLTGASFAEEGGGDAKTKEEKAEEAKAQAEAEAKKKELLDAVEGKVKEVIEESQKDNVKKEDVDAKIKELNDEVAKLNDEGMKELKEKVDALAAKNEELEGTATEQGLELKKIKDSGAGTEKMTFRQAIKEAIFEHQELVLTEKKDDNGERMSMKDFFTKKANKQTPTFEIKSAVDMLESNIVQNQVNLVRLTELDPQRVGIPLTIYPHVLDYMPSKSITRPTMSIIVAYSYEDGADTKTEGSASSQSSFLFKTVEFKSFNIATYFKLSDETLDDLEEALDEIAVVAPDKILDKIDNKILGTAGDDSSDIKGLRTTGSTGKSTDFAADTYANTVENANIIDLIAKCKLQCEANKYKPNTVKMNPTDVDNLAALKDALDNSITDRRVVFDAMGVPTAVMGLRIIRSTEMTADQLVVSDNSMLMIGRRKDMTMDIGLDADDFTKGQKTVRLGIRLAFGVRDKAANIWSNAIADDIDIIDKSGN